jgi:nucleoside-diphosphate-sugar epimerase
MEKILVIGAGGQLGSELVIALRKKFGQDQVVATDIRPLPDKYAPAVTLDAMDNDALIALQEEQRFTQVYHLAAILSAKGENDPKLAWQLNMTSLMNVLELGRRAEVKKIFWPSSIAVFGPSTPKTNTPQQTIMDPTTVYGISKLAGEMWCAYYAKKYDVDVRSIRYPGLVSYNVEPGGGTTDYAVGIFKEAIKSGKYPCFLEKDTLLPMMYIDDAVRGTIELMDAPAENISIRTSYNLGAMSFSPAILAEHISRFIPEFELSEAPDFRQEIADSWPACTQRKHFSFRSISL